MITKQRKKQLHDLAEAIAKNMSTAQLDALIESLEKSLKKPPRETEE